MKNSIKIFTFLLSLSVVLSSCGKSKKVEEVVEEKINTVGVQKLEKTTISRNLDFSVVLQANDKVAIAPNTAGRIRKIMVDVGSKVSKGQLLVQMDPANYDKAKVSFDNIAVDFDRVSKLNASNNIAKQTYDQTKAQYDSQKTGLRNLEENTFIRAPFSGVIEAKNFEDGELFTGSYAILSLVQLSTLKAYLSIPESYFPLVKKGMPIAVTSNVYPDETFDAEIDIIYPTIDATTHTFQVQIKIPNGNEKLRPGMYATVAISFGEVETLVVPYQSVLKLQGSNERYVYLNKNGIAERVVVTLGQRFDDKIEIVSNEIKEGDELVISGQARLNNGSELNIVK